MGWNYCLVYFCLLILYVFKYILIFKIKYYLILLLIIKINEFYISICEKNFLREIIVFNY